MSTVLVVDDNARIVSILAACLRADSHKVLTANDGVSAIAMAVSFVPDVALVDVMLPDIGGLELTRVLRDQGIPAIIISARTSEEDRIAGLDVGAEDYITKPFSTREVLARVRIALRHAEHEREARRTAPAEGLIRAGGFLIDGPGRVARYEGVEIELTRTEFDILSMLASNSGRAVSREALAGCLHGCHGESSARVVDSHVSNLRQALGTEARDRLVSVHGVGYRLDA